MSGRPEWFAPKRFGLGTGLPIAWQGWALLLALIGSVVFAIWLFGKDDWRTLTIIIPAALAFVVIAAFTTKGGWRWRWSWHYEDDENRKG